jgi:hypothetical protein
VGRVIPDPDRTGRVRLRALDHLRFLVPVSRAIVAAQGVFVMVTLGKDGSPPAYRPPPLFTGNGTLDKVLAVWHGACDESDPPSWEDMGALIWQSWLVHLVVVENRHRMKPARCVAVFPVSALLLGLPLYGFGGVLPMDNPRTAELSSLRGWFP